MWGLGSGSGCTTRRGLHNSLVPDVHRTLARMPATPRPASPQPRSNGPQKAALSPVLWVLTARFVRRARQMHDYPRNSAFRAVTRNITPGSYTHTRAPRPTVFSNPQDRRRWSTARLPRLSHFSRSGEPQLRALPPPLRALPPPRMPVESAPLIDGRAAPTWVHYLLPEGG